MDFRNIAASLKTHGYPPRKADAKIAHDIILKAIEAAGFHDKVTIKGGVVMSGITDAVRRATIDMDFDFLGYSLGDTSTTTRATTTGRSSCAARACSTPAWT